MRSYIVKEKHISSAVGKILRYTQTDRHPVTFICGYNNFNILLTMAFILQTLQNSQTLQDTIFEGLYLTLIDLTYNKHLKYFIQHYYFS